MKSMSIRTAFQMFFNKQQLTILMPSCLSCLNMVFKKVDLFPNSKLLRYSGERQFTTATGWVLSLIIITILAVLLASMALRTINKQIIYTSVSSQFEVEPSHLTVATSPKGGFMFSISLAGWDFGNTSERLFDVRMFHEYYSPVLQKINSTQIPLTLCTQQHFNFSNKVTNTYFRANFNKNLCPPIDFQFDLQGKITSDIYSELRVTLERCNIALDPTCTNDAQFAVIQTIYQQFIVEVLFVNTLVNPGQQSYRSFYVEDRNQVRFSSSVGANFIAEIREDAIETDASIMPYSDIQRQSVVRISERMTEMNSLPSLFEPLISIRMRKSSETAIYSRTFNKIDSYFSYVGGLIGTIIGFMFILERYNEKVYEISLAQKLFKDSDNKEIPSESFHFGYYLLILAKTIFNFCKCNFNWKTTQTYIDCCKEVEGQLDVTYILRKLIFIDAALSKLLRDHGLKALSLREKPSLQRVKKLRKIHFSFDILKQKMKKRQGDTRKVGPSHEHQLDGTRQKIMLDQERLSHRTEEKQEFSSQVGHFQIGGREEREGEVEEIKISVRKVAKESREGRKISHSILQQIDQLILQQMGVRAHVSEVQNQESGQIQRDPGDSKSEMSKKEQENSQKVEKAEDFDFDLEQR